MRGIGRWMKVNGEAIYGTRPWKIYAEGPTVTRGMKRNNKGEEREQWDWRQQFTPKDIRFTTNGDTLYAIALAWPEDGRLTVRSLASTDINVKSVMLLGYTDELKWQRTADGLDVEFPVEPPCDYAFALRITTGD